MTPAWRCAWVPVEAVKRAVAVARRAAVATRPWRRRRRARRAVHAATAHAAVWKCSLVGGIGALGVGAGALPWVLPATPPPATSAPIGHPPLPSRRASRPVPEPSSLLLLAPGLVAVALLRRKRKR